MGTSALRKLLKSLCDDSVWNYAVLWKLRNDISMILTWEDGYFDHPKPREFAKSITGDAYSKGARDIYSLQFETSTSSGCSEEYQVGLSAADMSHLQYSLGEGVVGKVAFAREHYWASFNNIFTGKAQLIPECPEEWLVQFASGIKTIVLVPVLPHGVLQFGSLEEVTEDLNVVAYVKSRFNGLLGVWENTAPLSLKKEFQVELSSPLISGAIEYLNAPSTTAVNSVSTKDLYHLTAVNSVELNNDNLSATSVLPLLTVEDAFMQAGKDFSEAFKYESENKNDLLAISLAEISTPSVSINASDLEMVESKLYELSCLMEELHAYSDCHAYDVGMSKKSSNAATNSHPKGDMAGEASEGKAAINMDNKVLSSFLRFPKDSELHKALGPAFRKQSNDKFQDSSLWVEDTCETSILTCKKDTSERNEPSWLSRGGSAGYLLDAVFSNAYGGSDHPSYKFNSFKSSTSFSGHFAASAEPQKQSEASAFARGDSMAWSHLTSACVTDDKNADSTSSTLRSLMNTIVNKEQEESGCDETKLRKGHKMLNVNKRRARTGDSQKPRPRDRQLIQDRVKELRELVPNGAKCSIDGLLDRTIQHMLYLRSVTDQAEKLRQCVHLELAGCKNWRASQIKDNCQNGMSWAFELGNEFQMCPILVEDLAYPGHVLIAMICNEHALFLEIAQVIRGLELTILKGELESQLNNTWARFIVEASKGFHRLDIFWPLMQLLQRERKPISSKI